MWSKNGRFYNCFFLGNIEKENVFNDILERKNAFLGYKDKKFKQSKNWHFLTQGFGPKMAIFPTFFFLGNLGQKNVFNDILEQKNTFPGYKNKKLKKCKNWHFSKEVNACLRSKDGLSSNFILGNIGQENVFYDILERKKCLSRL